MSATIALPKEYGYVLASTAGAFAVALWLPIWAGRKRKPAKVDYPRPYAFNSWSLTPSTSSSDTHPASGAVTSSEQTKAEYVFNCAQRAHGQFLEHVVIAVPAMLVSGLQFPVTSAAMGAVWCLSRVTYSLGYVNTEKEKGRGRVTILGTMYFAMELGWVGLIGKMAFDMVTA